MIPRRDNFVPWVLVAAHALLAMLGPALHDHGHGGRDSRGHQSSCACGHHGVLCTAANDAKAYAGVTAEHHEYRKSLAACDGCRILAYLKTTDRGAPAVLALDKVASSPPREDDGQGVSPEAHRTLARGPPMAA